MSDWAVLLACALFLAGCAPLPRAQPLPDATSWTYADLRLLDPAGPSDSEPERSKPEPAEPELDLLAAYLRRDAGASSGRVELRLDFLDLGVQRRQDVYLAVDWMPEILPGATGEDAAFPLNASPEFEWEALLYLPAGGSLAAYGARMAPLPAPAIRLLRDPVQDSIVVSFDVPPSPRLNLQVFVTSPGSSVVADQSSPFGIGSRPPQPARLLLAFWDVFPAYTPAQALRRWDGAHTGPLGGRHGLFNLLRIARSQQVPVTLLDLRLPAALSALDYAGDLELIETLIASGIVDAPEMIHYQTLPSRFDLPASDIVYAQLTDLLAEGFALLLYPASSPDLQTAVYRRAGQRLLPIPAAPPAAPPGNASGTDLALQPGPDGLSLESRRALVAAATAPTTSHPIIVLGGSLPASTWGVPEIARRSLAWINDHPWIQPVSLRQLISSPLSSGAVSLASPGTLPAGVAVSAAAAPESVFDPAAGVLAQAAAQIFLDHAQTTGGPAPAQAELRTSLLAQAELFLNADRWSAAPQPIARCDSRADTPYCILASQNLYLVFDLRLGALTHAFAVNEAGTHQLIGPFSQLPPSGSTPVISGAAQGFDISGAAFGDSLGPYQAEIQPSSLSLSSKLLSSNGAVRKTFTLLPDGLRIRVESPEVVQASLPLLVDPWERFIPGWGQRYAGESGAAHASWGIPGVVTIEVSAPGGLSMSAFTDTRQLMGRTENPNTEFPAGHYLPFPFAHIDFQPVSPLQVEITFQ